MPPISIKTSSILLLACFSHFGNNNLRLVMLSRKPTVKIKIDRIGLTTVLPYKTEQAGCSCFWSFSIRTFCSELVEFFHLDKTGKKVYAYFGTGWGFLCRICYITSFFPVSASAALSVAFAGDCGFSPSKKNLLKPPTKRTNPLEQFSFTKIFILKIRTIPENCLI